MTFSFVYKSRSIASAAGQGIQKSFIGFLQMTASIVVMVAPLQQAVASSADSTQKKTGEGWIEKLGDPLTTEFSFNNFYEVFQVKTPGTDYQIYPNAANNIQLKVNYRFITGSYSIGPSFLPGNGDNDLKGKTNSSSYGMTLIFKHLLVDFAYTRVKGYYLYNTSDYIPWKDGDPYIQFPRLLYRGGNVRLGYSFNPRFSYRSVVSQTERQVKSAGSFFPEFNIRYYVVDDRADAPSTQKSNSLETLIGPGYMYTFVIRKQFYVSLGLLADAGYLRTVLTTRYPDEEIVSTQDNFIFRWEGKVGLGYNGRRVYAGANLTISQAKYRQEQTTAMNYDTRLFYHIFVGYRFGAPAFVTHHMDKLQQKMMDKLRKMKVLK